MPERRERAVGRRPRSAGARHVAPLLAALGLATALGCSPSRASESFTGQALGTTYSVALAFERAPCAERVEIERAIRAAIDEVDRKMSTYRPDSELSRFNRHDSTEPFAVSAETLTVLLAAREVGIESQGAFDITVGPAVEAWGFGPARRPDPPEEAEIERLRALVGWDKIKIDARASTMAKTDPRVSCDLSAIAKGYAVDRVSETLFEMGCVESMVEIGGEVRARGRNRDGGPWRIGVERPLEGERAIQRVVELRDRALATSGDYRNFRRVDGLRWAHTIDPRTARPARNRLASVSVVADSAMRADAYATAVMALGEEEGYDWAVERDLAAMLQVHRAGEEFEERLTPAFEALAGSEER